MPSVVAELAELERHGWEALSGTGGAEFYPSVMADDAMMVFPGMVLDKRQAIDTIESAVPWRSFELSQLRVIEVGSDAAIVAYFATAQRDGQPEYRAWMSSTYVRRDGEWRMLFHQQSPG